MNPLNRKIILASKSPRRSQLLRQAGFTFEVKSLDVEETYPADLPVAEVAGYLARKKAHGGRHLVNTAEEVLLTADSVVILGDTIFEKPQDRADAVRILKALSGQMHEVITGVCLLSLEKERVFSGVSKVLFDDLSDEEIGYYIDHYQPFDKAGAYAIQEWIGLCKIKRIEGTYTNIMGLPMELVYRELAMF